MSSDAVFFTSTTETPFNISEIIVETSTSLESETGTTGKFSSIRKLACDAPFSLLLSGTFLAVKIPERVENSTVLDFTKPDSKRK